MFDGKYDALRDACPILLASAPHHIRYESSGTNHRATIFLGLGVSINPMELTQMVKELTDALRAEPQPIDVAITPTWEMDLVHEVYVTCLVVTYPASMAVRLRFKLDAIVSPVFLDTAKVKVNTIHDNDDGVIGVTLTSTTASAGKLRDAFTPYQDDPGPVDDFNIASLSVITHPRPGNSFITEVRIILDSPRSQPWMAVYFAATRADLNLEAISMSVTKPTA